ncbi:MAG TPA: aldehyde dehydrogenase family protein [Burkholderiales bacterium]|nr:aldehyde dehydrogenase family protein [Burkholderiales bacterium]
MNTLQSLGLTETSSGAYIGNVLRATQGQPLASRSPIDGATLATIAGAQAPDVDAAIGAAQEAFRAWRLRPAPQRGELVRRIGMHLRARKRELAQLVTLEVGKIVSEAEGEVQEMIDICDFAVGLSRQLHGLTIASERPHHRMMEQWHPLGPIGVITAFNFPVAVWAWNAMLAFVCGDPVVWKPSEKSPLTALATQRLVQEVIGSSSDLDVPPGLSSVLIGDGPQIGEGLAADARLPLISATGSVRMGRAVAQTVARRLGRTILELGGNSGMILTPSADLELAVRAITFAAFGTAGQRCTTLRRLIVHESRLQEVIQSLGRIASSIRIGDPRDAGVLMGPLIDAAAFEAMQGALEAARSQGGRVVFGGERVTQGVPNGFYVRPTLVEMPHDAPILRQETFAPILYVVAYRDLDEAIAIHNDVPQGLSSAIFTNDLREAERFLGPAGSDCGIANVNIGTSGAEIGGAFGGEKETGGGRESGSDAWKSYMRRVTNTINYGTTLPLAQGVSFDV